MYEDEDVKRRDNDGVMIELPYVGRSVVKGVDRGQARCTQTSALSQIGSTNADCPLKKRDQGSDPA